MPSTDELYQDQDVATHNYESLSIRNPLVDDSHLFASANDPFVTQTGPFVTSRGDFHGLAPVGNSFHGLNIGGRVSFIPPPPQMHNTGYIFGSGRNNSYTNGTLHSSNGYSHFDGISHYNGVALDLSFLDDQYLSRDPYFNRSAEGGFHQYFPLTDPYYSADGNKENH